MYYMKKWIYNRNGLAVALDCVENQENLVSRVNQVGQDMVAGRTSCWRIILRNRGDIVRNRIL